MRKYTYTAVNSFLLLRVAVVEFGGNVAFTQKAYIRTYVYACICMYITARFFGPVKGERAVKGFRGAAPALLCIKVSLLRRQRMTARASRTIS